MQPDLLLRSDTAPEVDARFRPRAKWHLPESGSVKIIPFPNVRASRGEVEKYEATDLTVSKPLLRRLVPTTGNDQGASDVTSGWASIRKTFASWKNLEAGWDGEDAPGLSDKQVRAFRRFCWRAEERGIEAGEPYITSDGEIGIFWNGSLRASISFVPNDRFAAYCDRVDDEPIRISGPMDTTSKTLMQALCAIG